MFDNFKKAIYLLIFLTCMLMSNAVFAAMGVEIEKTQFSLDGKYAQFTIQLSKATKYKAFSLDKPNRIVIDITDGNLPNGQADLTDSILVKKIRYGKPNQKTLRIVLDMQESVKIIDSVLKKSSKNFPDNKLIISYSSISGKMPYSNRDKSGKDLDVPASMSYKYKDKSPFTLPTFKPFSIAKYSTAKYKPKAQVSKIKKPVIIKKPLIILDAGHGGVDPGAIGKKGTKEKLITLSFVKELRKILQNSGQYKVSITRSKDQYIKLKERVALAQKAKGDIFLSIHADSHRNPKTRGLSVYTISENRSKREANKLLRNSKRKNVLTGVNLRNKSSDVRGVLIDLARRDTKNTSIRFAETLVEELGDDAKLLRNTHRDASLAILTGMDIPSVLIELGYLSNAYEERLLRTKKYRIKLANGVKDALDKYFKNTKK